MSQENGERSGTAQERLFELWGEVVDLGSAMAVLQWDQETQMPPKGQESRGRQLATLAGLHHAKMTDPALADALDAAAEEADHGGAHEGGQIYAFFDLVDALPQAIVGSIITHIMTWMC